MKKRKAPDLPTPRSRCERHADALANGRIISARTFGCAAETVRSARCGGIGARLNHQDARVHDDQPELEDRHQCRILNPAAGERPHR
eukprot:5680522-Prymnesium_polylepis.1